MNPKPWVKHLDVYTDFSGGLNSVTDHTKMADKEVAVLVNMDISPRGTPRRRRGMVHHRRSALWADVKGKMWGQL